MKYKAVAVLIAVILAALIIPHYAFSSTTINPTNSYYMVGDTSIQNWATTRGCATASTLNTDSSPSYANIQYHKSADGWTGLQRTAIKFHVGEAWGTVTAAKLRLYVTQLVLDNLGNWHPYIYIIRKDITTFDVNSFNDVLSGGSLISSGSGLSFGLVSKDAYNEIVINTSALTNTPPDASGNVTLWILVSYDWNNVEPPVPASGTWNYMTFGFSVTGNLPELVLNSSISPSGTPTPSGSVPVDYGDPKLKCDAPYNITYNQAKIKVSLVSLGSHASADIKFEISGDAETWTSSTLGTSITTAPQNWTVTATELDSPKVYYYRALADDNGSVYYSPLYQFTTPDKSKPAMIQGIDTWLGNIGLGAGAWWLVFFILNLLVWWKLWEHKAIAIIISCCSFAAMVAFGLVSPWILIVLLIIAGGAIYTRIFRPGSE